MVIIPFRDRGTDPTRVANLTRVVWTWQSYGFAPMTIGDGRIRPAQFNRSAAYNRGMAHCWDSSDVFVFAESDMLIPVDLINAAVHRAFDSPGLVVPFTEYRALSQKDSCDVRGGADPARFIPERIMPNGQSIGAINVVSRKTMEKVGQWDEQFEGSWYDDNAMKIAFEVLAGKTRWVDGTAYHLWHLPGHAGSHLSAEDREATRRNRARLQQYRQASRLFPEVRRSEAILKLTAGVD